MSGCLSAAPAQPKKTYTPSKAFKDARTLWRHRMSVMRALTGSTMTPRLREAVMLAVASTNQCRYCVAAHDVFASATGWEPAKRQDLKHLRFHNFDAAIAAAVAYAASLAQNGFVSSDPVARAQVIRFHGERGRFDIELTARVMSFFNLWGNTLDAMCRMGNRIRLMAGRLRTRCSKQASPRLSHEAPAHALASGEGTR